MTTEAVERELERLAAEAGSPLESLMRQEERAYQTRRLLDERARYAPALERPPAQIDTAALERIVELTESVPPDLLTRTTRVGGDSAHMLPPAVREGLNVQSLLRRLAAMALADARARNENAAKALAHAKAQLAEIDQALQNLAESAEG